MFSRLYLGVHSPADIVAGGIIGCVILAYWIKIDTIVDRSISFGDNGMYCCSTDSLIVHFRGMNGTSVPFTISIQCQSGIQTVWKTFYTCANLPTYLELLLVSTAWSNKGYCFSPLPPPWWNAGYPLPSFSGSYCTDREPHHCERKVSWTSRHHRGTTRFLNLDLSI